MLDVRVFGVEAAGTTFRVGGGNIVPPPPISLHEPSRFRVFLEDISEVAQRRQLPLNERVSPRSRAPSESSKMRYVRVRLPPPPPETHEFSKDLPFPPFPVSRISPYPCTGVACSRRR